MLARSQLSIQNGLSNKMQTLKEITITKIITVTTPALFIRCELAKRSEIHRKWTDGETTLRVTFCRLKVNGMGVSESEWVSENESEWVRVRARASEWTNSMRMNKYDGRNREQTSENTQQFHIINTKVRCILRIAILPSTQLKIVCELYGANHVINSNNTT